MLLFHYLKNLYVDILRNPNNTFVKCIIIEDKKKKDKRNKERGKKINEKKMK